MNHSNRFRKIAQLLFTSDISDDEHSVAEKIIEIFDKAEIGLGDWVASIENNLEVFKNYHAPEEKLVTITEIFEETTQKQKEKYEGIMKSLKQAIDLITKIEDVEMKDMISNLTKTSEEFTELYNELTNLPLKIGENGFIQKFKDISQNIVDNNEPLLDVIGRIKEYMMKNIIGEQQLT